jgi:hypothetical protein
MPCHAMMKVIDFVEEEVCGVAVKVGHLFEAEVGSREGQ